ncbi:MmcQ/YjbR family DNA-binding protein [Actinomadura craniellae]|uniref:MmcQ/YjbR family DNA-binding protein n=1 Tax=Actinomadura craniellae TaxID=2231787 RepID=A0A365GWM1_9ACTN|nr:MmcQ/YjbR family DNA-binding protein [Actinomadura craniellae]RAY11214.1 MmcQ/YjbR family DNA-binding protein [Actinomadura craniellae]
MANWDAADAERAGERLAELAAGLPGLVIEESGGHTGYLLRGRRIAWLLVDHHGDDRLGLCVKAPPGEQETLIAAGPGRYYSPAYLGAKGWVGVDLSGGPDWDQITGLLEQAWRMSATKRALAAYDAAR